MNAINLEIGQNLGPAQKSLEDMKNVKQFQESLQNKMNKMLKKTKTVKENMSKLEKAKEQCTLQEKNVKDLLFIIDRKDRELKSKNQDQESSLTLINKTSDCRGMLLYEDEEQGDGLIGHYYDNENWLGHFKELKSEDIDFDWTNGEPLEGINPYNFSVEWSGWIAIPATDSYIFSIECDDGAELYINDDLVLTHNTKTIVENYKNYYHNSNSDKDGSLKINFLKSQSQQINLTGNIKIKIKLKYFHSIHTSIYTGGQVFIRLFWQNSDFNEELIASKYLYSSFFYDPIKITEYDIKESEIKRLHENDYAFMNSDRYILQDIPKDLLNSPTLKLKSRFEKDVLSFNSNTPINVFIGLISHYPNPLRDDFENTGLYMSLLQLDKNQTKGSKKLIAQKSAKLVIYKKSFNKGNVQIKLNKAGINQKGVPMVIFFGFDTFFKNPLICSGKEILISKASGPHYSGCKASSEVKGYKCEDGFSGKMRDEEGGMWASDSDGIGAWIYIKFRKVFKITKIEYRNRQNPSERNSKIEIRFSSGESKLISLKNNDEIFETNIESVQTDSIKFTIKEVYGTLNNGGAFNIYGLKCWYENEDIINDINKENNSKESDANVDKSKIPTNIDPLFKMDSFKPIDLSCFDSLSNTIKIDTKLIKPGSKLTVFCPESCSLSMAYVFGTDLYTRDSSICKSAYHAKKISGLGGLVTIVISDSNNRNFKGSLSNGIKSEGKNYSSLAISFESHEEEDLIILKPSSKLDIKVEDPNKGFTWNAAVITNVMDTPNGKFIKVILDGSNSTPISLPYPNPEKLAACGEKVKNRNCEGSLKKQTYSPILIRFVPSDYQGEISKDDKGFLVDNGQLFGSNNKPFGWSVDMKDKIYKRTNFNKPLLETLVEFPPPPNSKACTKSRPENLCEPVYWKVKVGKGKFLVKIFIGDPKEEFLMNVKVNNKYFIKNKQIPKNTEVVYEESIEAKDEFIEISSDCEESCDYSKTKLNAVQISPILNEENMEKTKKQEKATSCGNSFTGGRCETGPDVLHCLFDSITNPFANLCNDSMVLVSIPQNYKCKEYVGQYKCVKKEYVDTGECKIFCPKECQLAKCIY